MAANTDDRLPSVDKLTENNWPVWKLQISTYLQARELWSLCTGDEIEPVVPAVGANDAALAAYAQQLSRYQVRVACHGVSLGRFWKYNNFHLRISLWILLRPPVARYGEASIVWPRATCL